MNKKLQLLAFILIMSAASFAQVGIGTTTPATSAALDVSATDKGFLMPRMTTAQKTAIASPDVGLQVYDTDTKSTWTYNGTAWVEGDGGPGKFIDGASTDIAYYQDRVGIGLNTFSTGHKLYVESKKNTDGSHAAVKIDAAYEGTGTATTTYGLGAVARVNGTGTSDYAIGTQGIIENLNTGGTVNNGVGSWPWVNNSGTIVWGAGLVTEVFNNGTVNTGYAQNSFITNNSGATFGQASLGSFYMNNEGTITGHGYGLWIGGAGSGTVGGNSYALYIATPYSNVTGSSFAIYSENTADSYIEGNLGVGTATPLRKVHISGALRLQPQATAPTGGELGDIYVGTDTNLYFHNGTDWQVVSLVP